MLSILPFLTAQLAPQGKSNGGEAWGQWGASWSSPPPHLSLQLGEECQPLSCCLLCIHSLQPLMRSILMSRVTVLEAEGPWRARPPNPLSKCLGKDMDAQSDKVGNIPKVTARKSSVKVWRLTPVLFLFFHAALSLPRTPAQSFSTCAPRCAQVTLFGRRSVSLGTRHTGAWPDVRHVDEGSRALDEGWVVQGDTSAETLWVDSLAELSVRHGDGGFVISWGKEDNEYESFSLGFPNFFLSLSNVEMQEGRNNSFRETEAETQPSREASVSSEWGWGRC